MQQFLGEEINFNDRIILIYINERTLTAIVTLRPINVNMLIIKSMIVIMRTFDQCTKYVL